MSEGTFKFRELEPGKVELSLSIDGRAYVLPVVKQAAWTGASDLIKFLNRWPYEMGDKAAED
jgi:hypothetical protein